MKKHGLYWLKAGFGWLMVSLFLVFVAGCAAPGHYHGAAIDLDFRTPEQIAAQILVDNEARDAESTEVVPSSSSWLPALDFLRIVEGRIQFLVIDIDRSELPETP